GLLDELAAHAAGVVVVHADVAQPLAGRRVGIVRDQVRARRDFVEQITLVVRIDGADGDAVDLLGDQLLYHAFLVGDAGGRHGHFEIDVDLLVGGSVAGALLRDLPEVGNAVGDVGDGLLAAGGTIPAATLAARG